MRTPRGARAALADWQSGLLVAVRGAPARRARLDATPPALGAVLASPGLRFTRAVRASWCAWRASRAAALTLGALPSAQRARLVTAWLARGGGNSAFASQEREAFLRFLHAATRGQPAVQAVCRFERALQRLADAAWSDDGARPRGSTLRRARQAALVMFPGRAHALLAAAAQAQPVRQVARARVEPREGVWVAPGLAGGWRLASLQEIALWRAVGRGLCRSTAARRHGTECVEALLAAGVLVRARGATVRAPRAATPRALSRAGLTA